MTKPKQFDRMMTNLERAMELAPSHAGTIIAGAAQALHKAIRIAEAGEEWERYDISPTDGPRTGFMGRLLFTADHVAPSGRSYSREVFETQGGALVAVGVSYPLDSSESSRLRLCVSLPQDDIDAQRAVIMKFWRWNDGAMKMAQKLGWNTAVWID